MSDPDTMERYCSSYYDKHGLYNDGFPCPANNYCCLSKDGSGSKMCCAIQVKETANVNDNLLSPSKPPPLNHHKNSFYTTISNLNNLFIERQKLHDNYANLNNHKYKQAYFDNNELDNNLKSIVQQKQQPLSPEVFSPSQSSSISSYSSFTLPFILSNSNLMITICLGLAILTLIIVIIFLCICRRCYCFKKQQRLPKPNDNSYENAISKNSTTTNTNRHSQSHSDTSSAASHYHQSASHHHLKLKKKNTYSRNSSSSCSSTTATSSTSTSPKIPLTELNLFCDSVDINEHHGNKSTFMQQQQQQHSNNGSLMATDLQKRVNLNSLYASHYMTALSSGSSSICASSNAPLLHCNSSSANSTQSSYMNGPNQHQHELMNNLNLLNTINQNDLDFDEEDETDCADFLVSTSSNLEFLKAHSLFNTTPLNYYPSLNLTNGPSLKMATEEPPAYSSNDKQKVSQIQANLTPRGSINGSTTLSPKSSSLFDYRFSTFLPTTFPKHHDLI